MDRVWDKGLLFKIDFFLWRVWKGWIVTSDNLKRMKINIIFRCWCCEIKQMETMAHLFLTSPIAKKVWNIFAAVIGIEKDYRDMLQNCKNWWYWNTNSRLQYAFNGIPAIITWCLWKKRNKIKHREMINFEGLVQQTTNFSIMFLRVKYPELGIQRKS